MVFVAIAFATLLSEDLTCIGAGLLIAQGKLAFVPATLACYVGILSGDMLLVLIGRTLGRKSLETAPLRWWARPELVKRAEYWFERRGPVLIFASRFMPGTRVPAYFAAGALRAPIGRFIGWFALACAIWTPLLVGMSVFFGDTAVRALSSWASVAPALLVGGVAAWFAAKLVVNLSTWRGRRFALGRWRRLLRWQYWPAWVLTLVVGLRGRRATPAGSTAPQLAAPSTAGASGVEGGEWIIFHVRRRNEAQGRILAITEKRPVVLIGDGKRTIEELILADDATVTQAALFCEPLGARADEVPAAGERVAVVAPKARASGARLVDASDLRTDALAAAFEAASRQSHPDLLLGHYDVRAASAEALQRGELTIVGATGFTPIPDHVYASARSAWEARRLLAQYRRLADEAGT